MLSVFLISILRLSYLIKVRDDKKSLWQPPECNLRMGVTLNVYNKIVEFQVGS